MVALELIASPLLCRLFISDTAPREQTLGLAIPLLAFVMIPYVLALVMDLMQGMLRGLGYSTAPMIISLITVVGARIVWAEMVFPHLTVDGYSIFRLYLCYIISYVITIITLAAYTMIKWRGIKEKVEPAQR